MPLKAARHSFEVTTLKMPTKDSPRRILGKMEEEDVEGNSRSGLERQFSLSSVCCTIMSSVLSTHIKKLGMAIGVYNRSSEEAETKGPLAR